MAPSLARKGLKVVAAGADSVRPRHRGIVVLLYHRVGGGSGLELDLGESEFDDQMAYLAATRPVLALGDALDALAAPVGPHTEGPQPEAAVVTDDGVDPVVVTFDDGTVDVVEIALPILERHRVPALLYLNTEFVETGHELPSGGRPPSWSALADAIATGYLEIGSHTHSHALLDRAPHAVVEHELDRSVELIGERLGVPAQHFAYPKAVLGSPPAEALVRTRFRSAALGGTRVNRYGHTDPHRLARTPVQASDGFGWFRRKVDGGMRLEDDLRRALNRFRYAKATR